MYHWMTNIPGLYDDIYMDLTFVEVMKNEGIDAPASSHAKAYAEAKYNAYVTLANSHLKDGKF